VIGPDAALDTLLDLDGQQFTIEPSGYTVKFKARKVPATAMRPHGVSYSLTLNAPDGTDWSGSTMHILCVRRVDPPARDRKRIIVTAWAAGGRIAMSMRFS